MNSQRCSNCGFTNFADADNCKKCKQNLQSSSQAKNLRGLSTVCPKCSSNDTQSFQMAYQTGTSMGRVQNTSYNYELGVSVSYANASNQTILANQLKPPIAPSDINNVISNSSIKIYYAFAAFLIGGFFFLIIGGTFNRFFPSEDPITGNISYSRTLAGLAIFILAMVGSSILAFWAFRKVPYKQSDEYKQAQRNYQKQIEHWTRSWICLRCGADWKV